MAQERTPRLGEARTWRVDWDEVIAGVGCEMCGGGDRPDDSGYGLRIAERPHSDSYLLRRSSQPGYAVVIWRGRHVAEQFDLTDAESAAYTADVLRVARALKGHFGAVKMNLETLGNEIPHLHTHVRCRFAADLRPGQPLYGLPKYEMENVEGDVAALTALLRS